MKNSNTSLLDLGRTISAGMEVTQLFNFDGEWMISPWWLTVLEETTEPEFPEWPRFSMETYLGSPANYYICNNEKMIWSANPDHVQRAKLLIERNKNKEKSAHDLRREDCETV